MDLDVVGRAEWVSRARIEFDSSMMYLLDWEQLEVKEYSASSTSSTTK
jgi:hypothetical protein